MTLINRSRWGWVALCAAAALCFAYPASASAQDAGHEGHNHGPINPVATPTTTQPTVVAPPPQQPGQQNVPQATVQLKPGELPKIEFDTPIYDFGKMRTGKDVEHDFWFHNPGNGPLEILQVKPS
ncbi:MAG: DUF1573 domain-containing protein [Planctomycetes bacterium]|nr:DUF1573 domain-containing protein [Planctomycetota bacterium]